MQRSESGFTLAELMIVVAILAILAGIAIPLYTNYIETSRNTEAFNDMNSLRLAEEEYFLENNTYVPGKYYATGTKSLQTGALGWSPAKPDNKQQFGYDVSASNTSYSITATGLGRDVPNSVVLTLQ